MLVHPTYSFRIHITHVALLTQLEIWGRAQHEAARRPKSDWKYNLRG